MRLKVFTVVAAAAMLSLTAAGSAAAQSLGSASQHTTSRPAQVTGVRLQSAFLPITNFGQAYSDKQYQSSGSRLRSTHAKLHITSLSCRAFSGEIYISEFGDTAAAAETFSNPDWESIYPDDFVGQQYLLQFGSTGAATTVYDQTRARYAACHSFSYTSGGETDHVSLISVSNSKVGGYQAFTVIQSLQLGNSRLPLYLNYLYVLAGTNIYNLGNGGGTQGEPSTDLMLKLIHRVQALYPHHK